MSDRTCSVDGCNREVSCRDYCAKHYTQWWKHGTVREPTQKLRSYPEIQRCSVEGCDRSAKSKTLCPKHYQRWRKTGNTTCDRPIRRSSSSSSEPCSIDGCGEKARSLGWCKAHYMRWRRHGDPLYKRPRERFDGRKHCRKCGVVKPVADFWRADENYDKLRTLCKSCDTQNAAAWRKANHDRVVLINRVTHSRLRAEWGYDFAVDDFALRMQYFSWKCWICGAETNGIDHVKPIVVGGPHLLANLRPCCPSCNARKGGVWPITSSRLSRWRAS